MISAVIKYDDNRISIHSSKTKEVGTRFEKGFYEASTDQNGNMSIKEESLPEIHDIYKTKENEIVMKTVQSFFNPEAEKTINQLGFIHKMGILLYGRQGTGKTSCLNFVANYLVENMNGIVLFCNNGNTLDTAIGLAKMIREIQNNPIIFIADEFERYASDMESEMKNFLDGKDSISNSLFLGATNYVDKVPETLKDRPSRFKVVQEVKGIEDKSLMSTIFKDISNKINPNLFTEDEIKQEVDKLKDVTLDEIKHICLDKATNCFLPKQVRKTVGFNASKEEDEDEHGFYTVSFDGSHSFWGSVEKKQSSQVKPSNI